MGDNAAGDCVFCTRDAQPPLLFETDSLYVMPDKYPLRPGHILAISKAHLPCFGAAPVAVELELDRLTGQVAAFLAASYGEPAFVWENGVAGQSVYHAHLHFIPAPVASEDAATLEGQDDAMRIRDWQPVREHFARHGAYRYLAFGDHRYLIAGHGRAIALVRSALERATGLRRAPDGVWLKATTPDDVAEVARRWAASRAGAAVAGSRAPLAGG
jgi:diadenosine tetraphosphate (Ap4A) HIT family hydrolase